MGKKLLSLLLILTIILSSFSNNNLVLASEYEGIAINLGKLGMFKGTGDKFDLDKPCDRLMGAVIFTRFIGKENEAGSKDYKHPFKDVYNTYADKYVGYLFSNGLVQGQSSSTYGKGVMTANQYATFMLRALNYIEGDDFDWFSSINTMVNLGIIDQELANELNEGVFLREDAVILSYKTLLANMKNESKSLANKLLWDDVFTTKQLEDTLDGKLMIAADMPDLIPKYTIVYSISDLEKLILLSMKNNQLGVGIRVPGVKSEDLLQVYNKIISRYHWKELLAPSVTAEDGYIYPHIGTGDQVMMEFYYEDPNRFTKNYQIYRTEFHNPFDNYYDMYDWSVKIDGIVGDNTSENMSDREIVKALHDYLVLSTKYDSTYEGKKAMSPHFASQVIFEGHGVCDGYAEAFKILMNGAGIECKVIYGDTPYGLHAWNQVKIDSQWYNIDVTWADPDDGKKIYYDYFCKADKTFNKDHWAEKISSPELCLNDLKW